MRKGTILLAALLLAGMAAGAHASISTPRIAPQKPAPVPAEAGSPAEIPTDSYTYDDDPIFCTFLVNITEKRARIFAVWGSYPLTESELLEVMYRAGTDPAGYVDGQNLYAAYFVSAGGVDPLGLFHVNVGGKVYDYDTVTGTIKVLKKNNVWQRIPAGGPKARLVKEAAAKLQKQFSDINATTVKDLFKHAEKTKGTPAAKQLLKRQQEVLKKLKDPRIRKLKGLRLLEKVGIAASVVSTTQGIVATIEDPSLENIAKTGLSGAQTATSIGSALGSKVFVRLALPVAVVSAVVNDIPTIAEFLQESYGLGKDQAMLIASQMKTKSRHAGFYVVNAQQLLTDYSRRGEPLRMGSLRDIKGLDQLR